MAPQTRDKKNKASAEPYVLAQQQKQIEKNQKKETAFTAQQIAKIQSDIAQFRAAVQCPSCHTTGNVLLANDTNALYDPPAPMFDCTHCGTHHGHKVIIPALKVAREQILTPTPKSDIISNSNVSNDVSTPPPSTAMQVEVSQPTLEFIHDFPQLPDYLVKINQRLDAHDRVLNEFHALRDQIEQLTITNAALTATNTQLQQKNAALERELKALRHSPQPTPAQPLGSMASQHAPSAMATTSAIPALPTPSSMSAKAHRGPSVGPRSFAEVTGNGKKPPTPKKKVHPRQIEAAARRFSPPTNTTGFKYVYLHQKHRMTIRQLRDTLRKLKIDNSRILDVHFPDRGVVGLLIHNDFEQEPQERKSDIKNY